MKQYNIQFSLCDITFLHFTFWLGEGNYSQITKWSKLVLKKSAVTVAMYSS